MVGKVGTSVLCCGRWVACATMVVVGRSNGCCHGLRKGHLGSWGRFRRGCLTARWLILWFALNVYACSPPSQNDDQDPRAPYPPSPVIQSIRWHFESLTRRAQGSDLWPVTWASDDSLYTSWGDGGGFGGTDRSGRVSLGFARIRGAPTDFTGTNVWGGKNSEHTATFGGKCAGMLSVEGTLYAWINLQDGTPPDCALAWSPDLGETWRRSSWRFPGEIFCPEAFLNFGKDYAGARDEYVYSYGETWGNSKEVGLVRVPKGRIMDQAAYEYFVGLDSMGKPAWTSDARERGRVFVDPDGRDFNMSPTVVYNSGIKRYILTVSVGGPGGLGVFDAPEPWGPWTTVAYYKDWGGFGAAGEGLLYSFPSKWISPDGCVMWCVFSATGELDSFNLLRCELRLREASQRQPRALALQAEENSESGAKRRR